MKRYLSSSKSTLIYLAIFCTLSCSDRGREDASQAKNISNSIGLYLPENLEATLWAESPLFYNPTNMDVDIKGRIWVTEAVNYRSYRNDSTKFRHHFEGDRVMILEDTNADGRADISKVYVQDKDLLSPVGIAVIGNKVIVSCSPNMIVYTDTNGDDKPDNKEILLTGFGGLDHDHSLHAVFAGPDGNWLFNVGNAGPHLVRDKSGWTLRSGSMYTGGSPYNTKNEGNIKSDDGKVWVGGLALQMKPDGTGLKVLGHNFRNSYEVIPDSYGNMWQNDNDDQVVTCRTSWLMEGGNAGYFSTDGTRMWQADQRPGQDIFTAHWHQDDPGVMPAGDRSGTGAPTGIVVNESGLLGKEYEGMVLSADAGRNVIFSYKPTLSQSGFDLGKRTNFISSLAVDNPEYVWNDTAQNKMQEKWFRPSDVTIGTDGAIYIADWYDPVVGGHQMQDSIGYGRIYRIAPKGTKKLTSPVIDISTSEGQIAALKSPAINVRNHGFEKLKQQGENSVEIVKTLLSDPNPYIKARATWLLAQLGNKGRAEVEKLLADNDVQVRATAYRALRQSTPDILPVARKMSSDPSAFVRREVAISLRDLPYSQTKEIILEILKRYDGEDRWYLETLGTSLAGHESEVYPEVLNIFSEGKAPPAWNKQMTRLAWRLHPPEAVAHLAQRSTDSTLPISERQAALTALAFVNSEASANKMVSLTKSPLKDVAESATYWISFRQSNDWYKLLDWTKVPINTSYERKLATMKTKQQLILDGRQSISERRHQVFQMAADSVGGQLLMGLAADKKLPEELLPFVQERIFQNPNTTIRVQASNYFKRPGAGKIFSIEQISKTKGDVKNGHTVFASRCASCHKVGSEGSNIGPELTTIHKKFDNEELLDAIINPSAAIVFGYEAWMVNTKQGTSVFGFLVSENKNVIVIKDITGQKHTIEVKNIQSKKQQKTSLMPDATNNGLSEQDLADIVQFLKSKS